MWSLLNVAAWVAVAVVQTAADRTVGAFVDGHGITHLYGNSFGRPGYNETYDYIIVGGGNAGNTIAARLALDPANYTVAVLEAGSFYEILDGNRTQIPGYNYVDTITFPLGTASTPTLWGLATEPQPGFGGRSAFYAQGQTFGGSTAANYMGYQRSTVGTFDQWAQLVDDNFWTWENVYPAYKKSATFQPPDYTKINPSINITYDPSAYSTTGGPLHVSYGNYQGPYSNSFAAAMADSGLKPIGGFNSGNLLGYGTITATVDTRYATRDTSESSFLQEAARKTSIKIYPQAIATKIVFNDQKAATGVEVQSNVITANLKYLLTARKEVIVSAGVWHSPQLLMVSGVGPAKTLQEYGIDVVADLPGVGQNEMDQPVVSLFLNLTVPTNTQLQVNNPDAVGPAIAEYIENQSGPLSGIGTGYGAGFEKFPASLRANFSNSTLDFLSTYPADWPEVEYLALESVPVEYVPITPYDNFIILSAVMLAFQSKGNMTISSSSILDPPVISPNWLTTDADVEQVYAAFLRLREISSHWSTVQSEVLPGPDVSNKTAILAYVQGFGSSIYHGSSTCRMGLKNDTEAVVDSRGRVYGVSGLRVVDSSSFPTSPPGHPMSTVYMLAEKIAESILSGN